MNKSSVVKPRFYPNRQEGAEFSFTRQFVVQQKSKATRAKLLTLGKKASVQTLVLTPYTLSSTICLTSLLPSVLQETSILWGIPARQLSCIENSSFCSLLSLLNPGGTQSNELQNSMDANKLRLLMGDQLKTLFHHWSSQQYAILQCRQMGVTSCKSLKTTRK